MRSPKSGQGFTLIEVLLAMALLSVMMTLLFVSLKICAESWEKGEKKIFEVGETAGVVNFFQRHLVMTKPLWNDFVKEERHFSFQGDSQSLQFVSAFPASAGRAGLQLFTIRLLNENRENIIKVAIAPFYPVADGDEWRIEEETLIRHVASFSVAYFGQEAGENESRWLDQWLQRDQLPKLVKIKIDLENGVFWPEMIIELKMAGSVNASGQGSDQSNNQENEDTQGNDNPQNDDSE
ncbi:prepilin-type N-terminal cleavage/methylation domain-containing protein [Methylomicrobium sp. Wu6]|uniref:prepilin-type N-terminal cleavage/methylation domain-containing protein n=1 Tax=Methylomicrobium sp. Wu6 TaxID=3107928 RepID=UPI002DD61961|nr:prepilin-type N-terminal cleavage/methylation domain-containing protein [Methylomicrobium sp. Wu6]MEC4748780.1 prepilin-type N-terminal cleavage/methylation domain-containing protein [Methylomicrobium sp. Wu6]